MEENNSGVQDEAAAPVERVEEQSNSRQVPLEALEAERAQRQQLQDEMRVIKENLMLMQSQQQHKQQKPQVLDGLQDDDILTVGEAKKYLNDLNSKYEVSLEEIKIAQKYPDYEETIKNYLPNVIKNNPRLRKTLEQTQDYELAYYLARNSDEYRQKHQKKEMHEDAKRILENSQKTGSLASVGQNSPISEAKRWRDMSDDEFARQVSKNLGYY